MEDDQRHQLACGVFNNDEKWGNKNLVEILAEKTVQALWKAPHPSPEASQSAFSDWLLRDWRQRQPNSKL